MVLLAAAVLAAASASAEEASDSFQASAIPLEPLAAVEAANVGPPVCVLRDSIPRLKSACKLPVELPKPVSCIRVDVNSTDSSFCAWAKEALCLKALNRELRLQVLDRWQVGDCLDAIAQEPELGRQWHQISACLPHADDSLTANSSGICWDCGVARLGGNSQLPPEWCDSRKVPMPMSCESNDQWGAVRRLMARSIRGANETSEVEDSLQVLKDAPCGKFEPQIMQVMTGMLADLAHSRNVRCLQNVSLEECSQDDKSFCMNGMLSVRACFLRQAKGMPESFAEALPTEILSITFREYTSMLQSFQQFPEFMTSSAWPFSYQALYAVVAEWEGFQYRPQAELDTLARRTILELKDWGHKVEPPGGASTVLSKRVLRLWALGLHAPLLQESLAVWRRFLSIDGDGLQLEITVPIEGNYCQYVPEAKCWTDPRWKQLLHEHINSTEIDRMGFKIHVIQEPWRMRDEMLHAFADDEKFQKADVFVCSEPALFCTFFSSRDQPVLGYIGVAIQAYLRKTELPNFHRILRNVVEGPKNTLVTTSTLLSQETHWYTGLRLAALPPVSWYTGSVGAYMFDGAKDSRILLPNRLAGWHGEDLMNEYAQRHDLFACPATPCKLQFIEHSNLYEHAKAKSYASLARFRAAVFLPKAPGQMLFHDLYALGVPLFVPDPYTWLPLYFAKQMAGWVANKWDGDPMGAQGADFGTQPPYTIRQWDAWRARTLLMEYTVTPHVIQIHSVAELLHELCTASEARLKRIASQMQEHHGSQTRKAVAFWRTAFAVALSPLLPDSVPAVSSPSTSEAPVHGSLAPLFAEFGLAALQEHVCNGLGIEGLDDIRLLDASDADRMPEPLKAVPRRKLMRMLNKYGQR